MLNVRHALSTALCLRSLAKMPRIIHIHITSFLIFFYIFAKFYESVPGSVAIMVQFY